MVARPTDRRINSERHRTTVKTVSLRHYLGSEVFFLLWNFSYELFSKFSLRTSLEVFGENFSRNSH